MGYFGRMAEAKADIKAVEEGGESMATSPILKGTDTPGGAANMAKPGHETQVVGRLRAGIKTPKTRTDSLTRKYPA